jgi:hypothetical protein
MAMKELGAKYGKGSGRGLVNRAIRAELLGGDEALDALTAIHHAAQHAATDMVKCVASLSAAHTLMSELVRKMSNEIARRYELPSYEPEGQNEPVQPG